MKYAATVGIDPGTNTGVAVREGAEWKTVETMTIIEAIDLVKRLHAAYSGNILVRIEDARKRTYFGKSGPEKAQGAGSIKRDCSIWEDEMIRCKIRFEFVHPKNVKATDQKTFQRITGWVGRTSIHAREAGWLIL